MPRTISLQWEKPAKLEEDTIYVTLLGVNEKRIVADVESNKPFYYHDCAAGGDHTVLAKKEKFEWTASVSEEVLDNYRSDMLYLKLYNNGRFDYSGLKKKNNFSELEKQISKLIIKDN